MSSVKFTSEHEWIRMDDDIGTVGITEYAQEQLGDIVFVELPELRKIISKSEEAAVVESVKAASEVYAPAGGEVIEVNVALIDTPNLVNEAPMGEGWFFKMRVSNAEDLDELMDSEAYQALVAGFK